jgi:hypothetical protein
MEGKAMVPSEGTNETKRLAYWFYGPVERWSPGPATSPHGPIGVPHTEHVTSAVPAKLVEVNSPAGFERFVAALGQPAPELALPDPPLTLPDPEELISVAAEHDIEVLGPPGSLP